MSKPLKRGGHLLLACTSMYGICFLHPVIIPILRCPSVHCPSTISNILFFENAWPIKVKFYVEPMGRGNESLFAASGSHDHYSKTLQKILPRNQRTDFHGTWYNVVCSIGDSGLLVFVQMVTYFSARSNFVT